MITLIFILTLAFIQIMLYSYSHIYSHLYDLRLCSRAFVYARIRTHIYTRFHTRYAYSFTHTPDMRFVFMLSCVFIFKLIPCSCFLLKIYTFAPIHGRNPRDSLTLLYYLERKRTTRNTIFSEFMYTLTHTQLVQAMRIMRRLV
ncbi:hypothetical protein HanRHA438_Chr17g0801021 [Helianthus annuus]|nr:hypothetical protein HanRHA438_Chr17g0801021 [Helianthus annuus]